MIPSSLWGLVLLVWLVTPGFLSNALAARRRPQVKESGFVEASRIMLASVVFSTIGGVAAGLLLSATPWRLDLPALIADSRSYLAGMLPTSASS